MKTLLSLFAFFAITCLIIFLIALFFMAVVLASAIVVLVVASIAVTIWLILRYFYRSIYNISRHGSGKS